MNNKVSIIIDENLKYCDPFDEGSTEYKYLKNKYEKLLYQLDLDKNNYNTNKWNPFSDFIKKGNNVVIKPNLVRHYHLSGGNIFSVIVHPVIIKLVLENVFKALGKNGNVIVGDASLQSADFDKIIKIVKLKEIQNYYNRHGFQFKIKDFRST